MTDTIPQKLAPALASDRVEQLTLHLCLHPADLIDMRRLMQRFGASVADVQEAWKRLEQQSFPAEEGS